MTKFSFVSAPVSDNLELVKAVNNMLSQGWELYGNPIITKEVFQKGKHLKVPETEDTVIVTEDTEEKNVFYQALVKYS